MNQIKVGAILSYLSIVIGTIVGLVYTPFLLRMLGQSEYGLMSLANSIIGYLSLLNLGLGSAMVRYISKYRAEKNRRMEQAVITLFLLFFIGISIVTFIIGCILTFNVHSLFSQSLTDYEFARLQKLMLLISFNIAVGMFSSVFYAVIMAYEKFIFVKAIGVINTILTPLIMLPLLFLGLKSVGITIASTLLNIINVIIVCGFCFKNLKIQLRFLHFSRTFIKNLLGFSFFILMGMIVDKVYWGTDQFILGSVLGTKDVAIYNIGSTFTTYFMSFSTAITGLFLPRLTQMDIAKVSKEEFTNLFIKVGRIQFLILGLILGGFIILGHEFIKLWVGNEYDLSYWIAVVILVPFIVPLIQNLGLQMMYVRNLHKFRSIVLFIIAIINIVVSIPMAKHYGGVGCAAVTGASFIIGQILILNWFYQKKMGINIPRFWLNISRYILLLVLIILGFRGLLSFSHLTIDTWNTLFAWVFAYIILYCCIMWTFGMNKEEKSLIRSIIPHKIIKYNS